MGEGQREYVVRLGQSETEPKMAAWRLRNVMPHAANSPVAPSSTEDLKATARAAKLRYISGHTGGISRVRTPHGFDYRHPDGTKVIDSETLGRIRKLAVPPAYEDVWICPYPNGHLQAVGRDARGRKQYRYQAHWREVRDEAKYGKMLLFGKVLPKIRARVEQDLSLLGLPRSRVLAAIVRLLETTLMRVGNEEYAKTNKSYGLTTLRNRHVKVNGASRLSFDFRGKSGTDHHIDLHSRRLATIVRRCQDLPGQELFQYLDEDAAPRVVTSEDVNEYLHDISGADITAKDFRTWAATNLAALALRELSAFDSKAATKKNVLRAVESVAKMLGNTPAICRKCYIHPAIFDGYLDGSLLAALQRRAEEKLANPGTGLSAEEAAVTAFLSRQFASVRPERKTHPQPRRRIVGKTDAAAGKRHGLPRSAVQARA